MEGDANQMSQATLCRSGCGFYGNPAQDGLCSKCFKDSVKRKQSAPSASSSSSSSSSANAAGRNSPSSAAAAVSVAAAVAAAAAAGTSSSDNNLSPCTTTPELLSMTTASPTVLPSILLSSSSSNPSDSNVGESEKGGPEGGPTTAGATAEGAHAGLESMDTDASQEASDFAQQNLDKQKKKNRCQMCRKKVGLTGFECRCGGLFCSLHRYSDKHECSFDYKQFGAQEIRKNNPVVVGEKIQKI